MSLHLRVLRSAVMAVSLALSSAAQALEDVGSQTVVETPTVRRSLISPSLTNEVHRHLALIRIMAFRYFAERGTFAITNSRDLEPLYVTDPRHPYTYWYLVDGKPAQVPLLDESTGQPIVSSELSGIRCNLMTPPTSIVVVATRERFVAASKGNIAKDGACDEWSIDDNKMYHHGSDETIQTKK